MRTSNQSVREKTFTLRLLAGASLISLVATFASVDHAFAAQDASSAGSPAASSDEVMLAPRGQIKEERKKKLNMKELRRLDFRVTGSSCAACLGRIRRRIDKSSGVFDVAVAIRKPYGVAVIYDSTKTDKDKLMEAAKKDEKLDIMFHDALDDKIAEPPLVLVPKHNSLVK